MYNYGCNGSISGFGSRNVVFMWSNSFIRVKLEVDADARLGLVSRWPTKVSLIRDRGCIEIVRN